MLKRLITLPLLLAALLCAPLSYAEQKKVFGDYEVHYSVFNSTFITPEIAQSYGITRGNNLAVVNISVRKLQADGTTIEQAADVSGVTTDLMRSDELKFREVKEKGAIYYLAEFKFLNREVRTFQVEAVVDPSRPPMQVKFSTKLYTDE